MKISQTSNMVTIFMSPSEFAKLQDIVGEAWIVKDDPLYAIHAAILEN